MARDVSIDTEPAVRVVVVGGLDPGGGAGIARDLLTAAALGARAVLVGTAWSEQGPGSDRMVEPRPAARVKAALSAALARAGEAADAVKIGMLATAEIANAVDGVLGSYAGPVVYDPVLRASSGDSLYEGERKVVLDLARRSTLLTPNLGEAGWLLGRQVATLADARLAARALRDLGISAVLVKGGHLEGDAVDVFVSTEGETLLSSPRIAGPSPRGTGCALATAIAVELARQESVERAVTTAKTWLFRRIAEARTVSGEHHLASG